MIRWDYFPDYQYNQHIHGQHGVNHEQLPIFDCLLEKPFIYTDERMYGRVNIYTAKAYKSVMIIAISSKRVYIFSTVCSLDLFIAPSF